MVRRLILISIFLQVLFLSAQAQNHRDDQLLREIVAHDRQATVRIPFPGTKALNILSDKVSISSVRNKFVEIDLSPLTVEWFISGNFDYSIIRNAGAKNLITAATMAEAKGWTTYPTYTQYDSIMRSFVQLHPALCKLDTIGFSIKGKLMLALKISDNASTDEDEPEVFYSSTIHGDELGGFILMMRFAEYLLDNYSSNPRVRNLVDNLEIWINPLANPDGTYGTGNTISSPGRFNSNGIDLNRNFPDPTGRELPEQKETTNMIRFMKVHHFVISANFHSGDEVVNYPWDRWPRLHPDNDWFYDISRKYADTVHMHSAVNYMTEFDNGITDGYAWYDIHGGRQDYITYTLGGREVTIEMDFTKVTSSTGLGLLWQYNWRSLFGYLENALLGIHGHVTDKSNGKPLKAMIFINGHDADSSQVFSDSLSGSYTRFIAPGTWNLSFSAKGYYSTTVNNLTVTGDEPVALDVKLVPIINAIDTVATPLIIVYPNPSSEFIRIIFPDRQVGQVNVRIFDSEGRKVADANEVANPDTPIVFNVEGLASGWYSVTITNKSSGITDKGKFIVVKTP